ncbi:MAG: hypothetical protein ACLRO6_03315 [[Eubacterium] siraeum]
MAQAESNNIKACALPSIHLPLTREASVMAWGEGWCGDLSVVDFCTATEKIGYCVVPD